MKKQLLKILLAFIFLTSLTRINAQTIQLQYSGDNHKIIAAVITANKILTNPEFYNRIDSIQKFDNTVYTGKQIIRELNYV